jgi:alkaline phosphatase D
VDALKSANPFVKLHNTERGYLRCTVRPEAWTTDYVAVTDVLKPGGSIVTRATLTVEAGRPAIQS